MNEYYKQMSESLSQGSREMHGPSGRLQVTGLVRIICLSIDVGSGTKIRGVETRSYQVKQHHTIIIMLDGMHGGKAGELVVVRNYAVED